MKGVFQFIYKAQYCFGALKLIIHSLPKLTLICNDFLDQLPILAYWTGHNIEARVNCYVINVDTKLSDDPMRKGGDKK